jgi:hypothetical protein
VFQQRLHDGIDRVLTPEIRDGRTCGGVDELQMAHSIHSSLASGSGICLLK